MRGRREERIEEAIDHAAALAFAGAVALAAARLLSGQLAELPLGVVVAASSLVAYGLTARALGGIAAVSPLFDIRTFSVAELDFAHADELLLTEQVELVLTDADRVQAAPHTDELLLDDIVAELSPDSRVVRLFDPAAFRMPGQLNDRIVAHLRHSRPQAAAPDHGPDASDALHQALNELRRSLR